MEPRDEPFDPEPNAAHAERIRALTSAQVAEIDATLLSHAHQQWRKAARVIGRTMLHLRDALPGLPDIYFATRLAELVRQGQLEVQGDLRRMRFSEIRLPQ